MPDFRPSVPSGALSNPSPNHLYSPTIHLLRMHSLPEGIESISDRSILPDGCDHGHDSIFCDGYFLRQAFTFGVFLSASRGASILWRRNMAAKSVRTQYMHSNWGYQGGRTHTRSSQTLELPVDRQPRLQIETVRGRSRL